MSACLYFSGILFGGGNRHCPSIAILAPSNSPPLLRSIVERGASNKVSGRQKNQAPPSRMPASAQLRAPRYPARRALPVFAERTQPLTALLIFTLKISVSLPISLLSGRAFPRRTWLRRIFRADNTGPDTRR